MSGYSSVLPKKGHLVKMSLLASTKVLWNIKPPPPSSSSSSSPHQPLSPPHTLSINDGHGHGYEKVT